MATKTIETNVMQPRKNPLRLQPTMKADDLVNPPQPISVPEPVQPEQPDLSPVNNVAANTQNIITANTEEARRKREKEGELSALLGAQPITNLFQDNLEQFGATPEALQELQDIQLQIGNMSTESLGRQSDIARAGGRTMGGAARAVSAEQARNNVRSYGLASRAAVLQGNINTARELALQATNFAFQDRQLKSQNLIAQIDRLQGQVDDQTAQLLETDKRKYEQDLAKVKEMKTAIAEAMVSGASQQEIALMQDAETSDDEKLALAQQVVARQAGEDRNMAIEDRALSRQQQQAQIDNIYSQISERNQKATDALTSGSVEGTEAKNQKTEKALSVVTMAQELLNHPGLNNAVGPNFLARPASPFGAQADFEAKAEQLKNLLTLDNLNLMSGVLTDKDIEILSGAASRLGRMDVTQASYKEAVRDVIDTAQRAINTNGISAEQAQFYFGMDATDVADVDILFGDTTQTSTTSSFNPASYY